jgi:hypothetical protein
VEKLPKQVVVFILIESIANNEYKIIPIHSTKTGLHGLVLESSKTNKAHRRTESF